jgi:hypothetical protein
MWFKRLVLFCLFVSLSFLSPCNLRGGTEDEIPLKEAIKINDSKQFTEIEIDQIKYKFKIYDHTICYEDKHEEVKELTTNISQSPVLFKLEMYKLLIDTDQPVQKRFNEYMNYHVDPNENWNILQTIYAKEGIKITKDNFDKVLLDYSQKKNMQSYYLGEIRKDKYAALIIVRYELKRQPSIMPLCHYFENGRWYIFSPKDYAEGESKKFFDAVSLKCAYFRISESGNPFHALYLSAKKITQKRNSVLFGEEETPTITWRNWTTHLRKHLVEGEFVYFDGKYVTVMKRDGTKEKLEYRNLCLEDQAYVVRISEELKKQHEQELKEFPDKFKEQSREWITKFHDYKVEGEFVNYDGKFVTIKKRDGKTEQIEYARLRLDDKNYVQEKILIKKRTEKTTPKPK